MKSHILVPFDGSTPAKRGLMYASDNYPDTAITVLTVVDPLSKAGRALSDAPLDTGSGAHADNEHLQAAERLAREWGIEVRTVAVVGTPAAAIIEYANEHAFDAIVIGTHGRSGLTRFLFGSVAETVARRASMAVTLVKQQPMRFSE